jgi:hypothetical protein
MKKTLYKDNNGSVVIFITEEDYSGKEGFLVVEEENLPDAPQELWNIVDGKLITKEPPAIPLDELKAKKKAKINAAKIAAEYADIEYLGNTYQADADSQSKLTSAVLLCQAAGLQEYVWWSADNQAVTFTLQELIGLGMLIAQRSAALVAKSRGLKDLILSATTKEELENIKWE